jgi:hypothetical protein
VVRWTPLIVSLSMRVSVALRSTSIGTDAPADIFASNGTFEDTTDVTLDRNDKVLGGTVFESVEDIVLESTRCVRDSLSC